MRRYRHRRKKNYGIIGLIVVCLCLAAVLSGILRELFRNVPHTYNSDLIPYEGTDYPQHDYDWSNLEWNGDLLSYEDDRYTSLQGIDVSHHQKEIDWEEVRDAGIDFAFIRVGYRGYEYGYINDDEYFEYNMESAAENGIMIGVYFFSQATTVAEAGEEAEYVIQRLRGYDIQLPVVFDMEEGDEGGNTHRVEELDRTEKTRMAVTFLRRIEDAGYTPMIYNSSQLYDELFDLDYLQDYRFWVADYDSYPKYPYTFDIWQYTSDGHIPGIDTRCDMNIMFIEKEAEDGE